MRLFVAFFTFWCFCVVGINPGQPAGAALVQHLNTRAPTALSAQIAQSATGFWGAFAAWPNPKFHYWIPTVARRVFTTHTFCCSKTISKARTFTGIFVLDILLRLAFLRLRFFCQRLLGWEPFLLVGWGFTLARLFTCSGSGQTQAASLARAQYKRGRGTNKHMSWRTDWAGTPNVSFCRQNWLMGLFSRIALIRLWPVLRWGWIC